MAAIETVRRCSRNLFAPFSFMRIHGVFSRRSPFHALVKRSGDGDSHILFTFRFRSGQRGQPKVDAGKTGSSGGFRTASGGGGGDFERSAISGGGGSGSGRPRRGHEPYRTGSAPDAARLPATASPTHVYTDGVGASG